jgi:hypothetical protein
MMATDRDESARAAAHHFISDGGNLNEWIAAFEAACGPNEWDDEYADQKAKDALARARRAVEKLRNAAGGTKK